VTLTQQTRPKRIQLRRTKGWRKPEGAVVVSRPSKWGNPITLEIERLCWTDKHGPSTPENLRAMAALDFRMGLPGLIADRGITYPSFDVIRAELAGHDLACWCPLDQPCHADVLLEIANAKEPNG
jgi:hypothetical protein